MTSLYTQARDRIELLVTRHAEGSSFLRRRCTSNAGPVMRRTIDNASSSTGALERGDWETWRRTGVRSGPRPLEPLYDVLAEATAK